MSDQDYDDGDVNDPDSTPDDAIRFLGNVDVSVDAGITASDDF